MSRAKVIVAGVALAVAGGIGAVAGATQHTVEYRTITIKSPPEVYTHVETKEVVKTIPLPESCKTLVKLTQDQFKLDNDISVAAGKINQAVNEGVTHLAMNEPTQWDDAEQAVIDAQHDLNTALVTKGENEETLKHLTKECNDDVSKTQ